MTKTAIHLALAFLFAGVSLALAQSSCTYVFDPPGPIQVLQAGGRVPQLIKVTASAPECPIELHGPQQWLGADFTQRGPGFAEFRLVALANPSILPRTGLVTAGNARLEVQQLGCFYTVQPSSISAPNAGTSGGLTLTGFLTGPCTLSFLPRVPWIKFTQAEDNPRRFNFTVDPNPTGSPRAGEVWFGPMGSVEFYRNSLPNPPIFRVRQGDLLVPLSASVSAAGGLLDVAVNAQPGVPWTATTQTPWLRVTSGLQGVGQGLVKVAIFPNTGAESRTGEVHIAGLVFSVTQAVSSCTYTLSPESATAPATGGDLSFHIGTECGWGVSSDVSWITVRTVSGEGSGEVRLNVAPNPQAIARSAGVTVAGKRFTVNQQANPCNFSVSPAEADVGVVGGFGAFRVSGEGGCSWTASTAENWIEVRSTSTAGGEVVYVVSPNYSPGARTGRIGVAGAAFTISQRGPAPQISTAGLLNAASFQPGPVAPGELVTLFGQGMGPAELVTLQVENGVVTSSLAGVRVLFDGIAAPMVFASAGQLSAVAPYELAGKTSTQIEIEYQGTRSNVLTAPVAAASPGIFTMNASGAGQGAILNEDLSVNSTENPAARGSIVVLYATGAGQTAPGGVNGLVGGETKPVLPVAVRIGGADAEVLYAGSTSWAVSGVLQVNVRIPASVGAGSAVPVELLVGGFVSRSGVTLAVGP